MDLKLTVRWPNSVEDFVVSVDSSATLGDVAQALRRMDPRELPTGAVTLAVATSGTWRPLPPSVLAVKAGIIAGQTVTVIDARDGPTNPGAGGPIAVLRVLDGADAGVEYPLLAGTAVIGRSPDCEVRLRDPLVSTRHAVLYVGDRVEIVDQNSSMGIYIDGLRAARARLDSGAVVLLGDTHVAVLMRRQPDASAPRPREFNRSPLVEPVYTGVEKVLPQPPVRAGRAPLSVVGVLVPLIVGGFLYLVSRQVISLLLIALSPVLLLTSLAENWYRGGRAFAKARTDYRTRLAELEQRISAELLIEQKARLAEHPAALDCLQVTEDSAPLLWSRGPDHPRFLHLRLGLATQPSRSRYLPPLERDGDPGLRVEGEQLLANLGMVTGVPVVADLAKLGTVGVCGMRRHDVCRGVLVQLLTLHAPGEVALAALVPSAAVPEWSWLRWVPHADGDGPLGNLTLASDSQACATVVAEIEQLVESRLAALDTADAAPIGPVRAIVVLVDDEAAVDRGRLLATTAQGCRVGVYLIWTANRLTDLPAACRQYLDLSSERTSIGRVEGGATFDDVETEAVSVAAAEAFARGISSITDAAAVADEQSDLPRSATFLEQLGSRELAESWEAVADRWREGGSLDLGVSKTAGNLRALVGVTPVAPFYLDLREQGPHALVGGTTGSGKSELLQSWILGMAVAHSPKRVVFLLVDYKGGAAFADCVQLPHTVGLVTDLTPRLVNRALTSLKAERRYREHLLNMAGVPDLRTMEKMGRPDTPPSLVIVIDEFAALVRDVPEFVDGVIDIAQRGRSLGLHLVLATQRPAGVIRDNLRANTNLRVALRMADEEDSINVIGSSQAAHLPPDLPGRAIAKMGHGTTAFQVLHIGGRTPDTPSAPVIEFAPLGFGPFVTWKPQEDLLLTTPETGPTDIQRLVSSVAKAASQLGTPEPRKPWMPELPDVCELADLPNGGQDEALVFGLVDVPDQQAQVTATYCPDNDGTMAIVGTGGSGKSTVLRTLALASGASTLRGGGLWQVYGIDFGARGLTMLESLPHVGAVIGGDDHERIVRLLNRLRALVEERAVRYAKVGAGTVGQYRTLTGQTDEVRVLLLVDDFYAFRQAYETGPNARIFDTLLMLAQDGRSVGVHVVLTAVRPGAFPSALMASVQKWLVLRLVQENDLAVAGLSGDAFSADAPRGRGYLNGLETQVAVLGGSGDSAVWVDRVIRLAEAMRAHGVPRAPAVERLPDRVMLADLPRSVGGMPALGVSDETMAAIGFDDGGPFVLAGPPQSGRTTVLATLVRSLSRARPGMPLLHVGQSRSPVTAMAEWAAIATTEDEAHALARDWANRALAGERFALVVEGIPDYLGTGAEMHLQELVAVCARVGNCVIAEGDTSQLGSSWPLLQAVKSARHGLILQPDQADGDMLLRTPFPRLARAQFPPGRGLYVRSGRFVKVQAALPE